MSQKQPQDPHAQHAKKLASAVQRLRGWVGSDPTRTPELADALLDLTAHRLLGHAFAEAAADAQEAVMLCGKLLASHGPIGPYTPPDDAGRYFTAAVHLATIQVGIGLSEPAGRTLRAALEWKDQLPAEIGLGDQLSPRTAIWALSGMARATLASGDVGRANAYADAASARLAESGLGEEDGAGYLAVDVARLRADCRWAAGWAADALEYGQRAKGLYDDLVAGRLSEPGRLSPALLQRLSEPLFGLYRDVADRLAATGDVDRALLTRRSSIELLRGLAKRRGGLGTVQLASTLADLASDLLREDRLEEAANAITESGGLLTGLRESGAELTRLQVCSTRARVLLRQGQAGEALAALDGAVDDVADQQPANASHALVLAMRAESVKQLGDPAQVETADREFTDAARVALADTVVPEGAALASVIADRTRGVITPVAPPVPAWAPLHVDLSFAETTAAGKAVAEAAQTGTEAAAHRAAEVKAAAERAEAHRLEEERHAAAQREAARRETERLETERLAAERAAAERLAAERSAAERAEAERAAAEQRLAADEAARRESQRRREERMEAHRREEQRLAEERAAAERARLQAAQHDDLAEAQQAWRAAKDSSDRRHIRSTAERVVDLLRPRAQASPEAYGRELVAALEELSSARLRSGDWWGSRAPAKEAKALTKALGG